MSLLQLQDLGRDYHGVRALSDLTLDISTGARHAIIGPNGAGKTTLLNLIAGTSRPTSGRVLLDGHDITRLGAAARARRGIGRTWQHPALFPRLTAHANVALAVTRHTPGGGRRWLRAPLRPIVNAAAHAALDQVGLTAHVNTVAGRLPYGQRRLLELAIVLAARPRLMLLDEPSAGLSPHDIDQLVTTVRALPTDVTVMLIDHHLELVWAIADTVTVLDHGQHLATGSPEDLRANQRVQAAYLGAKAPPAAPTTTRANRKPVLLRVRGLRVGYQGAPVLNDFDLDVAEGEVLAILGRNGAGKTTLLNTLAGLLTPVPPTLIDLAGTRLDLAQPHRIARAGVALVPQGRRLFDLSVAEHLTAAAAAAAVGGTTPGRRPWTRDDVLRLLPPLRHRLLHPAVQLSGGEQQMLALARALLTNPRLLLLDEPSEGLAPATVTQLGQIVQTVARQGFTVLIAEQNTALAAHVADRTVLLDGDPSVPTTAQASP
ncbi:ABC-type sugar transport system ATPase subunit [Micromonospora pisi]|uniref:ABC-type sugar transport system ATPase subunit n=1 Tax=Micromonospora pisi TaxID=589240 RepID=A0A495JI37_9ACTN|nr:ATP-binding cassette domain-containing protein [Micromonospora pisi]RKR88415.1 ABC-type sugar transport system ATPase subunit [Micromonospora pisi]